LSAANRHSDRGDAGVRLERLRSSFDHRASAILCMRCENDPHHREIAAITVLDPKHAEEQAPGLLARQHHDDDRSEGAASHRLAEEAELREALDGLGEDVESDVDILFNDPVEGLLAAARHVDLLVMGSRGRGPLRAAILGSVSHSVARRASCPVLILPRG
jgi:nucleotide-binding universal stress UspA family protein